MNSVGSKSRALLAGLALIVISNVVVLGGVAYNRRGEPDSALRLTERELPIQTWRWADNDNSSIDLQLSWRVRPADPSDDDDPSRVNWDHSVDWLSEQQLRALGFQLADAADSETGEFWRQPSRAVFLALEFDGPAYQAVLTQRRKWLERAEQLAATNAGQAEFEQRLQAARTALESEQQSGSRLFVADADLNATALRARHPDRNHYAVVRGQLRVSTNLDVAGKRKTVAFVHAIDIDTVRVPHEYRAHVAPWISADRYSVRTNPPRFAAALNFGRRLEPWLTQMESIRIP
jgi:hypothetical protein